MSTRLPVHLGRTGPKSVELEVPSIEVTGDFAVVVENHGPPQHVHVAPADDLSRFASVADPNQFIDSDDAHVVTVQVADDRPEKFDGHLRIVTGYGTEETHVDVKLRREDPTRTVAVDESLGHPRDEPSSPPSITEVALGPGPMPIVTLAAIAVLIAVGAILIAADVAVVLGALAVLVGVGIAVLLLVR